MKTYNKKWKQIDMAKAIAGSRSIPLIATKNGKTDEFPSLRAFCRFIGWKSTTDVREYSEKGWKVQGYTVILLGNKKR